MKNQPKYFIFATVKRVFRLVVNIFQRHLSTPVVEEGKAGSSPESFAGVVICSCFKTLHSISTYSDRDKGACNRYTLINRIIGSGKTSRHRLGGNSDRLFIGSFSLFLLCFCVIGSAFPFCFFSFKMVLL